MTKSIDNAVRRAGIRLSHGSTRRGFLGRIGVATAALGTGGMVAWVPTAGALCSGESVTCNSYHGSNNCPGNTCDDGSWCVGSGCDWLQENCNGGATKWSDCCRQNSQCTCQTVAGAPSCCNQCIHGQTCSPTSYKVVCRRHSCC
jgi:hypothetical protein